MSLNKWAQAALRRYGEECNACTQAKETITGPDPLMIRWLLSKSRQQLSLIMDIFTDHCRLMRHLTLFRAVRNTFYQRCGDIWALVRYRNTQDKKSLLLPWNGVKTFMNRCRQGCQFSYILVISHTRANLIYYFFQNNNKTDRIRILH